MADPVLTLGEITKIAIGAGLASTILNQVVGGIKEYRKEKKRICQEITFLALQSAVVLEAFAIQCADNISNYLYLEAHNVVNAECSFPTLGEFPKTDNWKYMSSHLSEKALAFPNLINIAFLDIADDFNNVADPDERDVIMPSYVGKHGLLAWKLAMELRGDRSLSKFEPERNIVKVLEYAVNRYSAS